MVEASFIWTPDRLTEALKHHRLHLSQQSRQVIWLLVVPAVLIPLFGMTAVAWIIEVLVVLSVIFVLVVPYIAKWNVLRKFRKSPFYNEHVVLKFDETGLHEISGQSDGHFPWSSFTSAVHFEGGTLLFSGPKHFRWIPTEAFANPTQIPEFEQLLRVNLNEYKEFEVTRKQDFKSLLLNCYRGITADSNSDEQSTIHYWSIRGFWLSFLIILFFIPFANGNRYQNFAAGLAVLALIICGLTFVSCVLARETRKWKNDRWRFSIKALLIVITVVGLALGGLMLAITN